MVLESLRLLECCCRGLSRCRALRLSRHWLTLLCVRADHQAHARSSSCSRGWQEDERGLYSTVRMKSKAGRSPRFLPRMRVLCGEDIALGPGKADLLALVGETGSIREAAERMGMSYMRAWTLIKTINACFREPLVVASRGGKKHGGAVLTATGRTALKLYRGLEAQSLKACRDTWRELRKLLTD
jgi:molybdate transport system regulatory protein